MKKTITFTFITSLLILCLSACGSDDTATPMEQTTVEPVAETKNEVVEEVNVTKEAAEPVGEPEKTESEWVDAYKDFLSDSEKLQSVLTALPWASSQLRGKR